MNQCTEIDGPDNDKQSYTGECTTYRRTGFRCRTVLVLSGLTSRSWWTAAYQATFATQFNANDRKKLMWTRIRCWVHSSLHTRTTPTSHEHGTVSWSYK